MATATIGQLTLTTSADNADLIEIERASDGGSRKITRANLLGATFTGGGTIALGGFTLTVPATGTASLLGTVQTFTAAKTFSAGIDGFIRPNATTKTIAAGAITATATYTGVDTEASAATDDLDTINGGTAGDIIIIVPISAARTVVIKDGTGNISCPSDRSLTHSDDTWMAIYNGVRWCEISFADNAA